MQSKEEIRNETVRKGNCGNKQAEHDEALSVVWDESIKARSQITEEYREGRETVMEYKDFIEQVREQIQDFLPEKFADATVSVHQVVKNNDCVLDGLTIRTEESNISPTVYLNPYFERIQDGAEMDDVLGQIVATYQAHYIDHDMDVSAVTDFDNVKDKIVCKLINEESNRQFLEDKPYTKVEDLAVVYQILMGKNAEGTATITITDNLMDRYGITLEDLHEQALLNMDVLQPYSFKGMSETIIEMMAGDIARLYKYPFNEQMLIYAQRPDATACASLETWNEKMNCWVNRGAKGIALIDTDSERPRLKYVFDVSDVHKARRIGRAPNLWELKEEHKAPVLAQLEKTYGGTDVNMPFEERIMEIADRIAQDYYEELLPERNYVKEGSFLDDLDELNLGIRLRETLASSISFTLLSRCGADMDLWKDDMNFEYIHEFNNTKSLAVIGNATTEMCKPLLMEIGRTIGAYERQIARNKAREKAAGEHIGSHEENVEIML